MAESTISTLVLYADYTTRLSYYDDWLDAFRAGRRFDVTAYNICQRDIAGSLKRELPKSDLVVVLHSANGDTTAYLERIAPMLADRPGMLLSFVGNEVNLPGSPISAKRRVLGTIRPDFIATQLPLDAGEFLWGDLVQRDVLAIPHALNPDAFRPEKKPEQRTTDIGVRAARYVAHLGDDQRNQLFELFEKHDFQPGLVVDISTQRLDRTGWAAFLNECRGTVSSEAGSWFLERDDATVEAIRDWTASHNKGWGLTIANDSPLREFGHKLPWPIRTALRGLLSRGFLRHESAINEALNFDDIYEQFFKNRPRPEFYGKCISSRHFDAIGTKTCQILVSGRYNDAITANEHYLSLHPDFSNVDEVVQRFLDPEIRERITDNAYEHIMSGHTYSHRIAEIEEALD